MPGRYGHPTSIANALADVDGRNQTGHSTHMVMFAPHLEPAAQDPRDGFLVRAQLSGDSALAEPSRASSRIRSRRMRSSRRLASAASRLRSLMRRRSSRAKVAAIVAIASRLD
jgi:hypothetical protein